MAIFSPSQSYRALEETQTEADSQGELTGNFYHVFNSTSRLLALDGNTSPLRNALPVVSGGGLFLLSDNDTGSEMKGCQVSHYLQPGPHSNLVTVSTRAKQNFGNQPPRKRRNISNIQHSQSFSSAMHYDQHCRCFLLQRLASGFLPSNRRVRLLYLVY